MKTEQKTAVIRTSLSIIVVSLCIGITALHMYFVYMSGRYIATAKQMEGEIYTVRNEIVGLMSAVIERVDTHNVAASHLVIAEPVTVSSARTQ